MATLLYRTLQSTLLYDNRRTWVMAAGRNLAFKIAANRHTVTVDSQSSSLYPTVSSPTLSDVRLS